MITDSQEVTLFRKMLEDFWAYSSGESLDKTVTFSERYQHRIGFWEG